MVAESVVPTYHLVDNLFYKGKRTTEQNRWNLGRGEEDEKFEYVKPATKGSASLDDGTQGDDYVFNYFASLVLLTSPSDKISETWSTQQTELISYLEPNNEGVGDQVGRWNVRVGRLNKALTKSFGSGIPTLETAEYPFTEEEEEEEELEVVPGELTAAEEKELGEFENALDGLTRQLGQADAIYTKLEDLGVESEFFDNLPGKLDEVSDVDKLDRLDELGAKSKILEEAFAAAGAEIGRIEDAYGSVKGVGKLLDEIARVLGLG